MLAKAIYHRRASGGRRRRRPVRGAAQRSRPAFDSRVGALLQERHVRGDRRHAQRRRDARRPLVRGAGAAGRAGSADAAGAAGALGARRALHRAGPQHRIPAAAARRQRARSARFASACRRCSSARSSMPRSARRWRRRSARWPSPCSWPCCSRSCCCGRFTSSGSGLTRLGKGEFGVRLDLDQDDEFGELGTFFNTMSAQLSADRSQMAGQVANLESAVEHLEDAVAIVSPQGDLLFANPAMRALLPARDGRRVAERCDSRRSRAAAARGADAHEPPVARTGVGDLRVGRPRS